MIIAEVINNHPQFISALVRSGAAYSTAIGIRIQELCCSYRSNLIRKNPQKSFISDAKGGRMLAGVYLVVEAGVVGRVIIYVVLLIHVLPFLLISEACIYSLLSNRALMLL